MGKVTVYQIQKYDISQDAMVTSRRMATEEGARIMHARIIPDTGIEIDESELEAGEQWTRIDFHMWHVRNINGPKTMS